MMAENAQSGFESIGRGIEKWLHAKWPHAAHLRVSNMGRPEVGASNETLFFDAKWTADGKPQSRSFVARLKAVSGPQVFPEYDLAKQYRIVELLQNTDVPVPRLYGYEADESVIGVPFYIMGRVEGRLPLENPPYPAQGWLKECTTAERAEIWKSGIEAFARIHKLDWKKLGFGFLDRPERGAIPLDQELHYYREFYDWTRKGRRHPLCEETMAWLDANKPAREPVGLCWGDAKLGNMVFKGTHCEAVFDWELVHLGNPVDDVAWYLMLDACLSEGCGIPRLDGFLSREETVAHWERASGLKAQNFEYYEVFSAYRFSLIMYRIISMRKETGGWPADSDYDVNNLASFVLARHMASRR